MPVGCIKLIGLPDCAVNPDIHKNATSFAFEPPSCTPGLTCTGVRAIVISFTDSNPIEPGSVLYTCNFAIDSAGVLPRALDILEDWANGITFEPEEIDDLLAYLASVQEEP
jgi:hypothetical protein